MLYDLSRDYRRLNVNRLAGVSKRRLFGSIIHDSQLEFIDQTSALIQEYRKRQVAPHLRLSQLLQRLEFDRCHLIEVLL